MAGSIYVSDDYAEILEQLRTREVDLHNEFVTLCDNTANRFCEYSLKVDTKTAPPVDEINHHINEYDKMGDNVTSEYKRITSEIGGVGEHCIRELQMRCHDLSMPAESERNRTVVGAKLEFNTIVNAAEVKRDEQIMRANDIYTKLTSEHVRDMQKCEALVGTDVYSMIKRMKVVYRKIKRAMKVHPCGRASVTECVKCRAKSELKHNVEDK